MKRYIKSAFEYTSSRPMHQKDQKHLNAKPVSVRKVRCAFHQYIVFIKYLEHFPKCFIIFCCCRWQPWINLTFPQSQFLWKLITTQIYNTTSCNGIPQDSQRSNCFFGGTQRPCNDCSAIRSRRLQKSFVSYPLPRYIVKSPSQNVKLHATILDFLPFSRFLITLHRPPKINQIQ